MFRGTVLDFETVSSRFKLTLEGKARLWIEEERFNDFNELKNAFVTKFSPPQTIFERTDFYCERSRNSNIKPTRGGREGPKRGDFLLEGKMPRYLEREMPGQQLMFITPRERYRYDQPDS